MTRLRASYDAVLHLLDRQIVDVDDAPVANVDDLELRELADGRLAISALLIGPGALGPRTGGRLGAWMVAIWRRLRPDADPRPGRIDARLVTKTDSAVHVSARVGDLQVDGFEQWVRVRVVEKIPGADRAE